MARRKRVKVTWTHETTVPRAAREKVGIPVGSVSNVTNEVFVQSRVEALEDQAGSLSKYASVKRAKASLDRSRRVEH